MSEFRLTGIEHLIDIPRLVIHDDCKSIFYAYWNFVGNLTFEESLEGNGVGGYDSEGNELPEMTMLDVLDSTCGMGFWAFSDSIKKEIHIWKGDLTFEEALVVIGHGLRHQVEANIKRKDNAIEDVFQEELADNYGFVSLWSYRFAKQLFSDAIEKDHSLCFEQCCIRNREDQPE
jgi:hypothetical protein